MGRRTVADVAVEAVRDWAAAHEDTVDLVRFVLFSPALLEAFAAPLAAPAPSPDSEDASEPRSGRS